MGIAYKKEFFDREYSAWEAYRRVWKYARPYKFRLFVGVICGMLTAGTLLPLYQVVQPALQKVSQNEKVAALRQELALDETSAEKSGVCAVKGESVVTTPGTGEGARAKRSKLERQMAEASKLPSWYPKAEKLASKLGITLQNEDGSMGGALVLIAIFVIPLVAFSRLILIYLNQYCLSWAGSRAVADLRVDVLKHVQSQSMQFFGRVDIGQVMSRCTADPAIIQTLLQGMLMELVRAPFEIFVSVGFIIYFAIANHMVSTLAVIVIGMPLFMLPVVVLGKIIRRWSKRTMERSSVVGSHIMEVLTCMKVIKAYNTEAFEVQRYSQVNHTLLGTIMKGLRWGLLVGPTVETAGIILLCGFLVYCFATDVALSSVVPMLAPLLLIYKPIKQLSSLQVSIETAQASLQRLWSVMDVDMALPEKPSAVPKHSFDDRIVFDDVCFRYDSADTDAVKHASFEIPRGKMVAVVGSTGSGKSTMSSLLARFYDPRAGRITMDGVDLRDMRISDLRELIGSVQQETLLFNETIEENIRYGSPNATHDEVVAAAKLANAHEFILSQPEGYARLAGDKGFALSGGERQRIAIARAILRNPPILILDEATSALDTVTERLVQDALTNLMANRTVFAIAHRLSTIRNADLILVMEHGVIVEQGTHDELYAANGMYRRLCDMQNQK